MLDFELITFEKNSNNGKFVLDEVTRDKLSHGALLNSIKRIYFWERFNVSDATIVSVIEVLK